MNKARVQSDAFQAAEIKLEGLCKASSVTYETFDLYESRDETNRRRVRLRTQIRRFVFFLYVKIKRCACSLFSQYHTSLSISLDRLFWKIVRCVLKN